MPTSLAGLVIIILVLLPGWLANSIYGLFAFKDGEEKDLRFVLRLIAYSLLGFVFYTIFYGLVGLPSPTHVFPSSYDQQVLNPDCIARILIPYAGHITCSGLIGLAAGLVKSASLRYKRQSVNPTWDSFATTHLDSRWVVISLDSGDSLAGIVKKVNLTSEQQKDLILQEPAIYDEEKKKYISSQYQYIFLPGSSIYSIAVVYDPEIDKRIRQIGESIFEEGIIDDRKGTGSEAGAERGTNEGLVRPETAGQTSPSDNSSASTQTVEKVIDYLNTNLIPRHS